MKITKRVLVAMLALLLACSALVGCGDTPKEKLASPTIRVEGESDTKIVWDAVEHAVSYIVTVNGTDMPAVTDCSVTLADDKEYTVTVRAIAEDNTFNSDPSNAIRLSHGFQEDAVVLRFAALSDVHVSTEKNAGKLRDVMLKTLEKYDIDAFMFPGDLTNAQNSDKNAVLSQMALFAAAVAKGNATASLPLVWCVGNHDFPTFALEREESFTTAMSELSYSYPVGTLNYDATVEICKDATATFFSADAWPVASLAVPDGFRYNLVKGFSFFGVDYTHVNTDTLAFLKAQLDAVSAKDPDKQIFITSHMPHNGGSQPTGLTELMKNYPQVIYISGHSHDTLQTYSAVVEAQGFVELNIGPGDHAPYGIDGPGKDYNNYQMKQGAIIEVDASGRMRFLGIDYSLSETEYGVTTTLDESYVVAEDPMVIRTAAFTAPSASAQSTVLYDSVVNSKSDERYHAPTFDESPKAAFTAMNKSGGKVILPTADAANVIMYYTVSVENKTTGNAVNIYDKQGKKYVASLKTPANHIYYPSGEYMPANLSFELKFESDVDVSCEYVLYLEGVDDFGESTAKYAFTFTCQNGTRESTGVKIG